MNTSKVIKLLNYENIQIIGSSKEKHLQYPSDIDLQDISNVNGTYDDIYQFFLHIFNKAYDNENLFIIDFKCGFYNGKPLKWTYTDMKNGYRLKNNLKISFKYALTHKSMIKLDIIAVGENKLLTEYSCNYYFNFIKYSHSNFAMNYDLVMNRLEYDYAQLMKKQSYFKALKRLYSISKIKKDKTKLKQLAELFNSKLGKLYKQKSALETVKLLLENNFKPFDKDIIVFNLNSIKHHLPSIYHNKINKIIGFKTTKALIKNTEQLIDQINDDINKATDVWLNKK